LLEFEPGGQFPGECVTAAYTAFRRMARGRSIGAKNLSGHTQKSTVDGGLAPRRRSHSNRTSPAPGLS
jgi:hypothetical protein